MLWEGKGAIMSPVTWVSRPAARYGAAANREGSFRRIGKAETASRRGL